MMEEVARQALADKGGFFGRHGQLGGVNMSIVDKETASSAPYGRDRKIALGAPCLSDETKPNLYPLAY
jgi:hypothetical protein